MSRSSLALLSLLVLVPIACGDADDDAAPGAPDAATTPAPGSSNVTDATVPPAIGHDVGSPAIDAGPMPQTPARAGYSIAFVDEFNDDFAGKPNPAFWDYDLAVINSELQCYTDARQENVRVEARGDLGVLVLQTRKEEYACPQAANQTFHYTSGGLLSEARTGEQLVDMSFGYYEIRAKIPAGKGTWPALWLLGHGSLGGWPNSGEIDIMEQVGYEEARGANVFHSTLHRTPDRPWPTEIGGNGMGQSITLGAPLSADFHRFGMEWTPTTLTFFVDDQPVVERGINYQGEVETHPSFNRADIPNSDDDLGWPFARPVADHQFTMILNLAFGGAWGGLEGIDDTIFAHDVEMLVDYVRVYRKDP